MSPSDRRSGRVGPTGPDSRLDTMSRGRRQVRVAFHRQQGHPWCFEDLPPARHVNRGNCQRDAAARMHPHENRHVAGRRLPQYAAQLRQHRGGFLNHGEVRLSRAQKGRKPVLYPKRQQLNFHFVSRGSASPIASGMPGSKPGFGRFAGGFASKSQPNSPLKSEKEGYLWPTPARTARTASVSSVFAVVFREEGRKSQRNEASAPRACAKLPSISTARVSSVRAFARSPDSIYATPR